MKVLKMSGIAMVAMMSLAPCLTVAEEIKEEILISNGVVELTNQDFEAEILRIPEINRFEFRASQDRINKVLDNLYINRALAQESRKAGLDKNVLFQKRLQLYADGLLAAEWLDHLVSQATVPDFEKRAREIYKAVPEKYTTEPMVSVSHILISTESRTAEEALERALDVRNRVMQGDKPFAELALEYSDDPSAKRNNGDLGFFEAGRMVKPFSDAAFSMKVEGELSQPVKTDFGYHIIRLQQKQDAKLRDFKDVKEKLIGELKEDYLKEIKSNAKSDVYNSKDKKVNKEAIMRLKTELPVSSPKQPAATN